MSKIIKIDDKSRIRITSHNYILEYWEKTKARDKEDDVFKWRIDGFFPNMVQCATEYILNAPRASCGAVDDLDKVIKVIKAAESRITKVLVKQLESSKK